jgi:hypothetical protein
VEPENTVIDESEEVFRDLENRLAQIQGYQLPKAADQSTVIDQFPDGTISIDQLPDGTVLKTAPQQEFNPRHLLSQEELLSLSLRAHLQEMNAPDVEPEITLNRHERRKQGVLSRRARR